ncbi:MAG: hypothetical protein R2879_14540 [Saprospiraceae bacterium]
MSEFEKWDGALGDKLNQYGSSVPSHTWERIQQKRKNKKQGLWLPLLFLGLAGALLWYFTTDTVTTTPDMPDSENIASGTRQYLEEEKPDTKQENIAVVGQEEAKVEQPQKSVKNNFTSSNKAPKLLVKSGVADKAEATNTPLNNNHEGYGREVEIEETPEANKPEQSEVRVMKATAENSDLTSLPGLVGLLSYDKPLNLQPIGPDGCFDFNKSSSLSAFYVEVLGGMDKSFKSITPKNPNSDLDAYINSKDSTESDWYTFSFQADAGMRYESGFSFRAGLQYSQINEKFTYQNESETRTTTVEIRDANGNLIRTETVVEEGIRNVVWHNRLRFLDIPVQIGFEKKMDKWTVGIFGGANINLLFKNEGKFLSKSLTPVVFSSDRDVQNSYEYFAPTASVALNASLGLGYELADNVEWRIEPQFRYRLNSVSEVDLDQKYWSLGLWTGIRYYLVNKN